MVPLATNGTIGKISNGTPNAHIGITIGTNGITNGTIGKTLNDFGIPLVPLGNPERTHYHLTVQKNKLEIQGGHSSP